MDFFAAEILASTVSSVQFRLFSLLPLNTKVFYLNMRIKYQNMVNVCEC